MNLHPPQHKCLKQGGGGGSEAVLNNMHYTFGKASLIIIVKMLLEIFEEQGAFMGNEGSRCHQVKRRKRAHNMRTKYPTCLVSASARQHWRLTICIEVVELTNSIR